MICVVIIVQRKLPISYKSYVIKKCLQINIYIEKKIFESLSFIKNIIFITTIIWLKLSKNDKDTRFIHLSQDKLVKENFRRLESKDNFSKTVISQ